MSISSVYAEVAKKCVPIGIECPIWIPSRMLGHIYIRTKYLNLMHAKYVCFTIVPFYLVRADRTWAVVRQIVKAVVNSHIIHFSS